MEMTREGFSQLVAVYGTLRQGFGNHRLLENEYSELLGTERTKPNWRMVTLGGFPGVMPGENEITIEVYRITSRDVMRSLNSLEGHRSRDNEDNFYNTMDIDTQWGTAFIYTLGKEYANYHTVETGDWVEHQKERGYTFK